MDPQKSSKRRRWHWLLTALVALIIVGGIATVFVVRHVYNQNLRAVSGNQKRIIVTIPTGSTVSDIAALLKNNGLIRSTWAFEQYVRNNNLGADLKAGTYALQPSQSVQEIVNIISEGKISTDLVTFVPGYRLDQIRKVLIQSGFDESAVDAALDPNKYATHPALVDKPVGANLEGYLYPESYQKTAETSPEDIIGLALDQMSQRLTPDLRSAFSKQGLSVYEGITLASIVQQEVPAYEERRQAAQVFLKRLREGIKLQSDITVIYGAIAAGQDPSLSFSSSYNTYENPGLTPGPISNVSESALEAAVNPAATDWLYFVSGDDGITYFSRTLEEHQALTAQHCKELCNTGN
ncbi:MAG: endolytic transglycosylase MltG [Candidatus Saccharibacteria bacterium]|nr:endolytic transglycosylase MltG [Candidatus Saccharibacteria bacterium]